MSRIPIMLFGAALGVFASAQAQTQTATASPNRETLALRDSCKTYLKLKEDKTAPSQFDSNAAASVGFCKGFFRGYMSASADFVTEPDAAGHITEYKIIDGTTFDQAIRVFLVAVDEHPEFLNSEAGAIILAVLKASGLATLKEKSEVYVRKR